MADDARDRVVPIGSAADIVSARQQGRSLASRLGFSPSELTVIALCQQGGRLGICVVACDKGPGIPDVERALRDGYSTHKGLGLGLPGARRLMDEFEIVSEVGTGTTVTMKKWAH
jgi:serine/threonine-protein kinase RsbT